jgi:hypothetical protein
MPYECFSDEVAIDFPAVRRVVERMRVSFHGERSGDDVTDVPEQVSLEVCLSCEDAARGVVLALEVPVRGPCPGCGGRGEIWADPCAQCAGLGTSVVEHALRVPVRPGVADGSTIRFRLASPVAGVVRVELRVAVRPAAL